MTAQDKNSVRLNDNSTSQDELRIIVAGGGTGGHIFPAIAIANAIKQMRPETIFLFVGAKEKWKWKKCRKPVTRSKAWTLLVSTEVPCLEIYRCRLS